MRTITETVRLYTFDELSQRAKDRVRWDHAEGSHYWGMEFLDTPPRVAASFGLEVPKYEVDFAKTRPSFVQLRVVRDMTEEEVAAEVARIRDLDNPWTDTPDSDHYRDGIVAAWDRGERDPVALVDAGFWPWLAFVQEEFEFYCSEAVIAELYEDQYFREDGTCYGRIEAPEVAHA